MVLLFVFDIAVREGFCVSGCTAGDRWLSTLDYGHLSHFWVGSLSYSQRVFECVCQKTSVASPVNHGGDLVAVSSNGCILVVSRAWTLPF